MGGTITTSKYGTAAYQMTEDWLAFGNPHISEFAVTILDIEPKTCHKVYLYDCATQQKCRVSMVTCSSRSEHIADYQLVSFFQESDITQRMMSMEFGELSVNNPL